MANDLHYVPGDNYLLDDISGFKIRARRARIIPGGQTGGLAVDPRRWEPQQPQDFVTGVPDDQAAELVRSRQPNQFTHLSTLVAAFAAPGATSFIVQSVAGFLAGDVCQVPLDDGNIFSFSLVSVAGNTLTFAPRLPSPGVGGAYADPLENQVVFIAHGSSNSTFILDVVGHDVLDTNTLG